MHKPNPQHRFFRLINAIRMAKFKQILLIIAINALPFAYLLYLNFKDLLSANKPHNMLSAEYIILIIPFILGVVLAGIVIGLIIKRVMKNYSVILIDFWLEKLFDYYWIVYFLDLNLFDQYEAKASKKRDLFNMFNVTKSKPKKKKDRKFVDFFYQLVALQLITPRILELNPSHKNKKIIKWIGETKADELRFFIVSYLIFIVPFLFFIFSNITSSNTGILSKSFVLLPLLPSLYLVIFLIFFIPKALAKSSSVDVLKAILCSLYLRDHAHEITDQRVLGIPKYINYPDLCKRVDSYMIDS